MIVIGTLTTGQHIERDESSPKSMCPPWLSPEGVLQELDGDMIETLGIEPDGLDRSICEQVIEHLFE